MVFVLDPGRVFCTMDHIVDTTPGRGDETRVPGGRAFIVETREAARAACELFSFVVVSLRIRSRRAGSVSRSGSGTSRVVIRLPSSPSSSGLRMLIGTSATNSLGTGSPRSSK